MSVYRKPAPGEASAHFFGYIDQVPEGDIFEFLEGQGTRALTRFEKISEPESLSPYAPGKWSYRQVVNHLCDCERIFAFRALWFARRLGAELPGFDQDEAAEHAAANGVSWDDHLAEFRTLRAATITMFRNLPAEAWDRTGIASGNEFTVRAMAYAVAGHAEHHLRILGFGRS